MARHGNVDSHSADIDPHQAEHELLSADYSADTVAFASGKNRFDINNPLKQLGWNADDLQRFQQHLESHEITDLHLKECVEELNVLLSHIAVAIETGIGPTAQEFNQLRQAFLRSIEGYLVKYQGVPSDDSRPEPRHSERQIQNQLNKIVFAATVSLMCEPVKYFTGSSKQVLAPISQRPLNTQMLLPTLIAEMCVQLGGKPPLKAIQSAQFRDWDGDVSRLFSQTSVVADESEPINLDEFYGEAIAVWDDRKDVDRAQEPPVSRDLETLQRLLSDPTLSDEMKAMLPRVLPSEVTSNAVQLVLGDHPGFSPLVGIQYLQRTIVGTEGYMEASPASSSSIKGVVENLRAAVAFIRQLNSRGMFYTDLKPENIRLSAQGSVVFSDLGSITQLSRNGDKWQYGSEDTVYAPENHGLQDLERLSLGEIEMHELDANNIQADSCMLLIIAALLRASGNAELINLNQKERSTKLRLQELNKQLLNFDESGGNAEAIMFTRSIFSQLEQLYDRSNNFSLERIEQILEDALQH